MLNNDFKAKYPKRYSAIYSFISSAPSIPDAIFNPAKDLCHQALVVCNSSIKFVEMSYKVLKKQYDDTYEPERVRDPNQRALSDQHTRDNPYAFR